MRGLARPRRRASWAKLAVAGMACAVAGGAFADTLYRYDNNGNLHVVTDPMIDLANCGAPGHACWVPPNAAAVCSNGVCGGRCAPGWANCDDWMNYNGCEVRINTVGNCGACGLVCPKPAHGVATCPEQCSGDACQARCGVTCDTGYTDCNNQCVSLSSDPGNCRACGNACPGLANGAPICTPEGGGTCGLICHLPFALCGRSCLDPVLPPTSCQPDPVVGRATECVAFPAWDMVRVEETPYGTLVEHRLPSCAGLAMGWPPEPVCPLGCGMCGTPCRGTECAVSPWRLERVDGKGAAAQRAQDCSLYPGLQWPL